MKDLKVQTPNDCLSIIDHNQKLVAFRQEKSLLHNYLLR